MIVGTVKEIKNNEYRVGLTPPSDLSNVFEIASSGEVGGALYVPPSPAELTSHCPLVAEIGTAHVETEIEQHFGDPAHAGAANPHEVDRASIRGIEQCHRE